MGEIMDFVTVTESAVRKAIIHSKHSRGASPASRRSSEVQTHRIFLSRLSRTLIHQCNPVTICNIGKKCRVPAVTGSDSEGKKCVQRTPYASGSLRSHCRCQRDVREERESHVVPATRVSSYLQRAIFTISSNEIDRRLSHVNPSTN